MKLEDIWKEYTADKSGDTRLLYKQDWTFFIKRAKDSITELYVIDITNWDDWLTAQVVWIDRLVEFISCFDD